MGTDSLGRSVWTQFVWGSRISLLVGLAATVLAIVIGTVVGVAAGFYGGRIGGVLMRVTEWFLVIPFLPLAIALAAVLGPSLRNIILVIGITSWPSTARLVRAQVLTVKQRLYVDRSRALGASDGHLMARHILPNIAGLVLANTTLTVPVAILSETTLAFLGLGDPTNASWGKMLEEAFQQGALDRAGLVVLHPARARHPPGRARLHAHRPRARRGPRPAPEGGRGMSAPVATEPLLSVRDLHVTYPTDAGRLPAVRGVSLDLAPGDTLGLAGESGCGKSSLAGALLRLLPRGAKVTRRGAARGRGRADDEARAAARRALVGHGDRLPGRAALAQPGAADRPPDRRGDRAAPVGQEGQDLGRASASCSSWSACRRGARATTRTSSRAASASAC